MKDGYKSWEEKKRQRRLKHAEKQGQEVREENAVRVPFGEKGIHAERVGDRRSDKKKKYTGEGWVIIP